MATVYGESSYMNKQHQQLQKHGKQTFIFLHNHLAYIRTLAVFDGGLGEEPGSILIFFVLHFSQASSTHKPSCYLLLGRTAHLARLQHHRELSDHEGEMEGTGNGGWKERRKRV